MTTIHSTATVSSNAELGPDCEIGANAVVENDVVLGPRCRIHANAIICSGTEMGADNDVRFGAVIGHVAQVKDPRTAQRSTRIGNGNVFGEYCQVHRASIDGGSTKIGNDNFVMSLAHVGHDCRIEDEVLISNNALVAGHVHVESRVVISGICAVHQFSRVGRLAIVRELGSVSRDIPPFMIAEGNRPCLAVGLNTPGLRRAGVDPAECARLLEAYRLLYHSGLGLVEAVRQIAQIGGSEVVHLVDFLKGSKRGIVAGTRVNIAATDEPDSASLTA